MTLTNRQFTLVCLVCLAAGWWLARSPSSPVNPTPTDRPVLRFIARAAKTFLWLSLVAEKPPADPQYVHAHARVGADGEPMLDHSAGW
jgi:hypothetical protein